MLTNFGKITNNDFLKKSFLNITLLLFIILCFGFPLANWESFISILIALYAIFLNKVNHNKLNWLYSIIVLFSLLIIKYFTFQPNIEVGEQIYSPNDQYLNNILPNKIVSEAGTEWKLLNQPFQSHPENKEPTNNPWAYSADSFFHKSSMSKRIKSLNFKNRYDFRVGVLNNAKYNYFAKDHGSYGAYYPLIFSFLIPNNFSSSEICWKGIIYIEENNTWQKYKNNKKKCIKLSGHLWKEKDKLNIYALDFDKNLSLSINIEDNTYKLISLLSILSAIIILLLTTKLNKEEYILIILSVISILLYMIDQNYREGSPPSFAGLPYMGRGNDGLTHYSYAREMVEALSNFNISEWLRGNENIFYMMPGMRYLYGITMPFFGESIFGILLIISLTPIIILKFLKKLFTKNICYFFLACFFILPIFESFGFYQIYFAKYSIEGFGAGIAMTAILTSFYLLWINKQETYSTYQLFYSTILFALAISLRPNFLPTILILLSGISLYLIYTKQSIKLLPFSLGFSPILLIGLHNYIYGQSFIPLTNSATIDNNMRNGPEIWNNCIQSIPGSCQQILHHINIWVSFTEPWYLIILACLLYIIFNNKSFIIDRIISVSLISGHLVFLFYEGVARYSHGIWLLSFIISLPVLKNNFIPYIILKFKKYKMKNESI